LLTAEDLKSVSALINGSKQRSFAAKDGESDQNVVREGAIQYRCLKFAHMTK